MLQSRHHLSRPSQPRPAFARATAAAASSSSSSPPSAATSYRRAAFDVAVLGVGASAAWAAAALSSRNLKTLWLDGLPEEAMMIRRRSRFHRRPLHTSARLACADPKLVALALEGLESWRSLAGQRFTKFNLPLLSEGGSLDLASSVPFADSSTALFGSGSEILEACAEAAKEAGVRGARLLSSSEVVESATSTSTSTSEGSNENALSLSSLLSSTNLPKKTSAGLWIPQGGSIFLPAAEEAAAAGALSAGVTRWGPSFRIGGWRDAGGGSRFEIRGKDNASSVLNDDDAPILLAEVERMVLVPPERGFEEFLACFGIALPSKARRKKEKEKRGAELRDVAWAAVGNGRKKKESFASPSFSKLSPCVLSHGLAADRAEASDLEAPRGGVALERWSFVPSNDGGGDFAGTVSVPAASAGPHYSGAEVEPRDDNEMSYLEFSGRKNEDEKDDDEEEEEDNNNALASSPFAEDARAVASAASLVLRPFAGSSAPRKSSCYAAETLVTGDGAPICGWAPLEIMNDDEDDDDEGRQQQQQQQQQPKRRKRSSFGALGSQPERVLVLCPSASGSDPWSPTGGPCATPAVATAAADLLSGLPSVRGPVSARQLSPTRRGVGFRCVEVSRDPWEV